jgi:hypothetical protein
MEELASGHCVDRPHLRVEGRRNRPGSGHDGRPHPRFACLFEWQTRTPVAEVAPWLGGNRQFQRESPRVVKAPGSQHTDVRPRRTEISPPRDLRPHLVNQKQLRWRLPVGEPPSLSDDWGDIIQPGRVGRNRQLAQKIEVSTRKYYPGASICRPREFDRHPRNVDSEAEHGEQYRQLQPATKGNRTINAGQARNHQGEHDHPDSAPPGLEEMLRQPGGSIPGLTKHRRQDRRSNCTANQEARPFG